MEKKIWIVLVKMDNIALSICIPGIRTQNWNILYDSIYASIGRYSFELIFVGPYDLPNELKKIDQIRYVQDFGSPTRCTQIGASISRGQLITWGSDDGLFVKGGLKKAIKLFNKLCSQKDIMCMRYTEGIGRPSYTKAHSDMNYWTPKYHWNKKMKRYAGINCNWKLAPLGLIFLDFFKEIGGFDCKYEHINMSTHDLAFRVQKNGGKVEMSPTFIMNCDWNPKAADYKPVNDAYVNNDLPVFDRHWSDMNREIRIDFNNWQSSPDKWRRFD